MIHDETSGAHGYLFAQRVPFARIGDAGSRRAVHENRPAELALIATFAS
ncbi:hypothetical protein [Actinoplanes sp. NPDC020271]